MWTRTICTVGAEQTGGVRELIGPGSMAYVTPSTAIAPGTVLANGHKVIVDAERGEVRGAPALVVTRLRRFAASAEDVAAYEALDDALRAVGLGEFALADPKSHAGQRFEHALRSGAVRAPEPVEDWIERMAKASRIYPAIDWTYDPEPAFDDIEESLAANDCVARIERAEILAEFEALDGRDDEDAVRAAVWSRIIESANAVLAARGRRERWHALAAPEPTWMLIETSAWRALLDRGLLARAD